MKTIKDSCLMLIFYSEIHSQHSGQAHSVNKGKNPEMPLWKSLAEWEN